MVKVRATATHNNSDKISHVLYHELAKSFGLLHDCTSTKL